MFETFIWEIKYVLKLLAHALQLLTFVSEIKKSKLFLDADIII